MISKNSIMATLKMNAFNGLADSSIKSVNDKLSSGYYNGSAINVNTGRAVNLYAHSTYVYSYDKLLALRIDETGGASQFTIQEFFRWCSGCLFYGYRLSDHIMYYSTYHQDEYGNDDCNVSDDDDDYSPDGLVVPNGHESYEEDYKVEEI